MTYTANGIEVFEASVLLSRLGAWTARLRVDGASVDQISGQVFISLDGFGLRGTRVRGGTSADLQHINVVGGAGGLGKLVTPRQFRATSFRAILETLLADGGEALSSSSSAALLDTVPENWTVPSKRLSEALGSVVRELGASWRVLPDGAVWFGVDDFPPGSIEDGDLLIESLDEGRLVYGVERPTLVPGVSLDGRRVVQVQHLCSSTGIRTEAWIET